MRSKRQEENPLVIKQYRIEEGIDPRKIETLPHIITLMIFQDAILSSVRWHRSLKSSDVVEAGADRTFSIVCGAGWAAEAIRLLKDLKQEGVISENTINKLPQEEPVDTRTVWTECVESSDSEEMNRLHQIRDACFAHFHNRNSVSQGESYELARQVIEGLASGELDVPFVKWAVRDDKKYNLRSCNTIAEVAIAKYVYGISDGIVKKPPKLLGEQILKVGILLDRLITEMMREAGIKLEPYVPTAEAETSGGD